uniref:Myb-like domain-containing protein n=1 Tax=Kalanchoe fedtschenkoi TaxID=63787 RepID=A0A7N0V3J0_KALFE
MSSSNNSNSATPSRTTTWTREEDKRFEEALALYIDQDPSTRWDNVVRQMGESKTVEEVIHHYQLLVDDVNNIEAGRISLPDYVDDDTDEALSTSSPPSNSNDKCRGGK